ncbi:MAG: hypothetical protein GJ680_02830 [Alteromonadaceae bacterium]|nr:hypothetical protein [Alteromonadaceae bacterium]
MQKQTGGYQELTEDQRRSFPSADRMIRFSPRAVTLAPQERQTVRLSLRRPDNLEPGEYRSHLAFEAIDDAAPTKEAERGVGIQVKINMAFSIPVVVRHRVSNVEVELTKPEFFSVMHNNEQKYLMQFRIINKGNASAFGNLKAYWQTGANTFSETPTGILNNVSVFTENPQRFMNLGLKEIPNRPTLLKLVYEGAQEMNGKIIDEIIVEADPKSFSSAY